MGAVGGGVVGVSYWCRRWRMRNRWEFLGEVSNVEKKKVVVTRKPRPKFVLPPLTSISTRLSGKSFHVSDSPNTLQRGTTKSEGVRGG